MKKSSREQWQHDIELRQRNLVFPDTAANEARFWRNIIFGKQKLTYLQIVGLALILSAVTAAIYAELRVNIRAFHLHGWQLGPILDVFGGWIIVLAVGLGMFLIPKVLNRRTPASEKRRHSLSK